MLLYYGFQKLEIYQLSKELVKDIYKLSSSFPSDEKYSLVQQKNIAAVSVASKYCRRNKQQWLPGENTFYQYIL